MNEEVLVNITPKETRVALIESGVLQEIYIERQGHRGIVGNIYAGKVCRVLPGMQAAFVEVGLERAAFLHLSEILPRQEYIQDPTQSNGHDRAKSSALAQENIAQLLFEGKQIVVQVIKSPLGTKGARLTTHLTIPSRYLVFLPNEHRIGISQRIEDPLERQRLRETLDRMIDLAKGGYIMRTAAEGASQADLQADIQFLQKQWEIIQQNMVKLSPVSAIHEDMPLVLKAVRDLMTDKMERIRIDDAATFHKVEQFIKQFIPNLTTQVELYQGNRPIFDIYGIEDEIKKTLEHKVMLKSGGYLIIEQTEAMSTIDVNTGGFVGSRNLEETIYKTNLEAAYTLVRQLRLRNLGGIIIIDFIDMESEEHKRQVLRMLAKELERDHAKSNISEVSSLGLVQMTRKRTQESLGHILCETCSVCQGRGLLKTPETVCYEVFREIIRAAKAFETDQLMVVASQVVIDRMLDEESSSIAELEQSIGRPIRFQVESLYQQEQYDVVPM